MPPGTNEGPPMRKQHIAMANCVFPEDIMLLILTRLPVRSILRFKSVCKTWYNLLSSPEFKKMHKGQFSSDPNNHSVIIHCWKKGPSNYRNISLLNIESDEKKTIILDHPHPEINRMNIIGCCNGLVCMGKPRLGLDNVVLWNPAMRLFKFVCLLGNVHFTDADDVSVGFGYDAAGDDFKVVRILRLVNHEGISSGEVEVYSVNSDSWITIDPGFRFIALLRENVVIVKGNPYFLVAVYKKEHAVFDPNRTLPSFEALMWLDVREMVVKFMPLVTLNLNLAEIASRLVDWCGSLAALVHEHDKGVGYIDVWVYDDGEQIWSKNHTFRPIEVEIHKILVLSENRKMVCLNNGKVFVFDPDTGWVKVCQSQLLSYSKIHVCLYTESLTDIEGMRPVEVTGQEEVLEVVTATAWLLDF